MLFSSPIILIYCIVMAILIGTVLGSFLNCVADRVVSGESFLRGRSHCSTCGHVLGPLDLIPVFSWIFNKGKCRYCGDKVSVRYPLTEIVMATCCILNLLVYDISWIMLRNLIFIGCLFVLSLVDLDKYEIPDTCIVIGIVDWIVFIPLIQNDWKSGLIGGFVLGGGIFIVSILLDKILKKESLGGGDIKLLFVSGLYLGVFAGLFGLIIACVLGLIMATVSKRNMIPFGPAISIGVFVMLLVGNPLVNWYLSLL